MNYEEIKKSFDTLCDLVNELYGPEPCGGPLHIILDDGNVRDSDLVFCYRWLHTHDDTKYVKLLCKAILHELALLTQAQRLVWWNRRLIAEQDLDVVELAVKAEGGIVEDHEECGNHYITSSKHPYPVIWGGWYHGKDV